MELRAPWSQAVRAADAGAQWARVRRLWRESARPWWPISPRRGALHHAFVRGGAREQRRLL